MTIHRTNASFIISIIYLLYLQTKKLVVNYKLFHFQDAAGLLQELTGLNSNPVMKPLQLINLTYSIPSAQLNPLTAPFHCMITDGLMVVSFLDPSLLQLLSVNQPCDQSQKVLASNSAAHFFQKEHTVPLMDMSSHPFNTFTLKSRSGCPHQNNPSLHITDTGSHTGSTLHINSTQNDHCNHSKGIQGSGLSLQLRMQEQVRVG